MKIKKIYLLFLLLSFTQSTLPFVDSLFNCIEGGVLLTAAFYAAQETKREHQKTQSLMATHCSRITLDEFADGKLEEIGNKCLCYLSKYKYVIIGAIVTATAGSLGAQSLVEVVFK